VNDIIVGTGLGANRLPFWDDQKEARGQQPRLQHADPGQPAHSPGNVRRPLAVRRSGSDAVVAKLDELATLRFKAADVRVYEPG
jgi:hypothetical protein